MPGGRGGPRTPRNPAAVSGPGALSARTDGGPTQPIRLAPGGPYGSRQDLAQQQRAAPLPDRQAATPSPTPQGARRPAPSPLQGAGPDLFAPTRRPNEPITAGAATGPGANSVSSIIPRDPHEFLLALHQAFPENPDISDLLNRARRRQGL